MNQSNKEENSVRRQPQKSKGEGNITTNNLRNSKSLKILNADNFMVTAVMKLKGTCSLEGNDKPRQHITKQRHYFSDKDSYSQSHGFPSSFSCMVLRAGP